MTFEIFEQRMGFSKGPTFGPVYTGNWGRIHLSLPHHQQSLCQRQLWEVVPPALFKGMFMHQLKRMHCSYIVWESSYSWYQEQECCTIASWWLLRLHKKGKTGPGKILWLMILIGCTLKMVNTSTPPDFLHMDAVSILKYTSTLNGLGAHMWLWMRL